MKLFLKFLPIAAAVLLATSCSKDDNDNTPATESGKDGVHTVSTNTIPFTIRVNTGRSLKKVGYAESTNEGEEGWYNVTFSDNDVEILKMIIKENGTQIGEATLQSDKATFSGGLTKPPSSNTASLTAEITVTPKDAKTFSNESLAALLATCAHTFLGTFNYGDEKVDLTDQNAYLAITYFESDKIDLNGSTIDLTDHKVWVAVPANAEVTSQALGISKPAKEVAPGTIYTVDRYFTPKKFSVSATKQVYFSSGNLQYNPAQDKWQFAAQQYDICIKADNNDVSSMYNKDYDGWIDLFGWGTWLNGNDIEEPYETQKDDATSYKWSGISAIGSEWTTLTCGDDDNPGEWNYLLGLNGCTARDNAENLKHWTTVNDVPGLVILPDGYDYTKIDWDSFVWTDLEKAGAVFLPASGNRNGTVVNDIGDYGRYWSSSSYGENGAFGLFFGDGGVGWGRFFHYYGRSVRLVRAAL